MSDEEELDGLLDGLLADGKRIAKALCEHVREMGASSMEQNIFIEDECYVVTVSHKPVVDEQTEDQKT